MKKNPMRKKICVICEICVTKKHPKKNLCISVKSVGLFPTSGGICNDRTGRICEICVTKKRLKKNLCKSVKSVGLFSTSGGICNDRTGRICEICVTKKTDLHR